MNHIITYMKILVIIATNRMAEDLKVNVVRLDCILRDQGHNVDYAGISSIDDFSNYEDIIQFRFKEINTKYQLTKVCNFIEKNNLEYDWFIRFRPEICLVEPFDFESLCPMSINARARIYNGPRTIPYGMSIELASTFRETESDILIDDQIYIFHKNVIDKGGFSEIHKYNNIYNIENETVHTGFWNERGIPFNIVSINALFFRDANSMGFPSGHINPV